MWGRGSGGISKPLWLEGGPDPSASSAVTCEVNAYVPQEAHVPWAAGLEEGQGCPRSLEGGKWFIATVQSPQAGYGVSAILHQEPPPPLPRKERPAAQRTGSVVTTATAVLSVFTRTPRLQSRLGQDVVIDCGFSGPSVRFSVEWRHQHGGAGRVVLAYDGASGRVSVAEEGARLFLDPQEGGNVSLQLQGVGVRHEGTYICTVYLPHMHAQQAAELRVLEPPKVALRPDPLSVAPGANAELACGISGYYPQSVTVVWRHRGPAGDEELTSAWESGHHQAPDGTFSFISYIRLPPVQPQDHGITFSCHVAHPALGETPLRKALVLHVAGSSGPSVEDAVGLFLIAFALFGFLQAFSRRVFGEKTKLQKVD
ncbi:tapasin isoform X2 [Sceloporus undulatus]|nr:tapasin isoform X2 [Sceloporus undulatus]